MSMDISTVGFNGYLPNGMKVFYEFPITALESMALIAANYDNLYELTQVLLAKGLSLQDPRMAALAAGEDRDSVGYVLRKEKTNKDGSVSSVIGLYPASEQAIKKYLWVYLDTQEQIDDFETATGVKLASMKVWPTKQAPDREPSAADFFTKVKDGVFAIYRNNPDKTDDEKDKFVPSRLFVRWETATPTPQPPPTVPAQAAVGTPTPSERVAGDENRMAELENQLVTITKAVKTGTIAGVGIKAGDKYEATAPFEVDGMTHPIRIQVFPEDVHEINEKGYPFTEGDNLRVPVILTTKDRGMTRIASVVPYKPQNAANANVAPNQGGSEYKPNWTVIYSKVKHLYDNTKHMGNSVQMMFREGAFKNCRNDADAINLIIEHKTGKAVGDPA